MADRSSARARFFDLSVDMLCIANSAGWFIEVNDAWTEKTGWSADELCARPFTDFVHPDDVAHTLSEARAINEGRAATRFENRYRRSDGDYIWVSWKAVSVPAERRGGEALIYAVAHDITERKSLEDRLRFLADHDGLTGLWSRRRFEQELDKQVARCRRYDERAALFLLDLDDFKAVNDNHGHAAGDEVLIHVADTLRRRLRASDSVARFGGDEFAVLLPHLAPDEAAATADAVATHLAERPVAMQSGDLAITASTGITFIDRKTPSAQEVMLNADRAMYDAKASGREVASGLRRPSAQTVRTHVVFHCDDSEPYRRLLGEMLTAHADIEHAGGAGSQALTRERLEGHSPDVLVADALMGGDDTTTFLAEMRETRPDMAILVLSGLDRCPASLDEVSDGFVCKRRTFDDIADAIREAAARVAVVR